MGGCLPSAATAQPRCTRHALGGSANRSVQFLLHLHVAAELLPQGRQLRAIGGVGTAVLDLEGVVLLAQHIHLLPQLFVLHLQPRAHAADLLVRHHGALRLEGAQLQRAGELRDLGLQLGLHPRCGELQLLVRVLLLLEAALELPHALLARRDAVLQHEDFLVVQAVQVHPHSLQVRAGLLLEAPDLGVHPLLDLVSRPLLLRGRFPRELLLLLPQGLHLRLELLGLLLVARRLVLQQPRPPVVVLSVPLGKAQSRRVMMQLVQGLCMVLLELLHGRTLRREALLQGLGLLSEEAVLLGGLVEAAGLVLVLADPALGGAEVRRHPLQLRAAFLLQLLELLLEVRHFRLPGRELPLSALRARVRREVVVAQALGVLTQALELSPVDALRLMKLDLHPFAGIELVVALALERLIVAL
mmetsp:Transcript_22145/g.66003  ORF Transcript_22145/g.66003 Transcript_22145/m.66003 type:complete len:415 (+) Transcript_22145:617-1861(+)